MCIESWVIFQGVESVSKTHWTGSIPVPLARYIFQLFIMCIVCCGGGIGRRDKCRKNTSQDIIRRSLRYCNVTIRVYRRPLGRKDISSNHCPQQTVHIMHNFILHWRHHHATKLEQGILALTKRATGESNNSTSKTYPTHLHAGVPRIESQRKAFDLLSLPFKRKNMVTASRLSN